MPMNLIRLQQSHTRTSLISFSLYILILFRLSRPSGTCRIVFIFSNFGAGCGRLRLLLVLFVDGRIIGLQSHLLTALISAS